mmetsp:Transcript_25913/g.56279  ORF Transcript_25913/g.56279 Transcript_25913/m.56279 type:complete len:269 (+) Transcript_25913:64-870(+)
MAVVYDDGPRATRMRRHFPEQDRAAMWWPPGPEGPKHPLKNPREVESATRRRGASAPPEKPAGRSKSAQADATPRGRKHGDFTISTFESQVALGKNVSRCRSAREIAKVVDGCAGKRAEAVERPHLRTDFKSSKSKDQDRSSGRPAENDAAGTMSGQKEKERRSQRRYAFHHPAANRTFHYGMHATTLPDSQAELDASYCAIPGYRGRGKSAARRPSSVGALMRNEKPPRAREVRPTDLKIYNGAAGLPSEGVEDDDEDSFSGDHYWH